MAQTQEAAKKKSKKVPAWRRVGRAQLAELMGVHPDTISDYTAAEMPVLRKGGHGKESTYDSVACLEWHRLTLGQDAKEAAQTQVYETQAILNRMKIATQRGELVPRESVVLQGQHYTKAWMAKVRALPRRLSNAGLIDRTQEGAAREQVMDLLTEISSGWKVLEDLPTDDADVE